MKGLNGDLTARRTGAGLRAVLAMVCLALLGGCAMAKGPAAETQEAPPGPRPGSGRRVGCAGAIGAVEQGRSV